MECKKGVVNVYDSLFTSVDEEMLGIIKKYFDDQSAKSKIHCNMAKVQKQKGSTDCGVFCCCLSYISSITGSCTSLILSRPNKKPSV